MKARHLEILQEKGFPVPKFILVSENEEVDLSFSEKEYFAVRSNFSAVWNIKKRRIGGKRNRF